MSLVRSVTTISGFTLISRVLGFVRDILIAAMMGAGWQTDAFFVAFKLPNFLRRLFAEGAFSAAFVPIFSGILAQENLNKAKQFAAEAFAVLLTALLVLLIIVEIAMPWVLMVLAPGFVNDPEKYALTIHLSRITFPYLLFISLVAMFMGILNSVHKFAAAAASPILMNLSLIFGLLCLNDIAGGRAQALSWGVFIAGVTQCIWMVWHCRRANVLPRLVMPKLTPGVKRLLILMAPVAVGAGVAQINLLVDVVIASTIPDAVSYLYYADRMNELPLGVIGIAIGTALLPLLSRQFKNGEKEKAIYSLNRAIELGALASLPAAAALAVISEPIIRVLFERGAFSAEETVATAAAMMAYALGLPAFVAVKALAPGFFANEDTKTPVKIAVVCMFINLVLNLLLMIPLQHVGLALATSIAGWLNVYLMSRTLYKRAIFVPDTLLRSRLPRMVLATVGMAVVIGLLYSALGENFDGSETIRILTLIGIIAAGKLTYLGLAFATRAVEWSEVKSYFKRGK